jgi:hypothetical protein
MMATVSAAEVWTMCSRKINDHPEPQRLIGNCHSRIMLLSSFMAYRSFAFNHSARNPVWTSSR